MQTLNRGQQIFDRFATKIIDALIERKGQKVGVADFVDEIGCSKEKIATQIAPQLLNTGRVINGHRLCRTQTKVSNAHQYWVEEVK